MKWIFTIFMLLAVGSSVQAQISCEYTLNLFDSFGDGWNGATLTVTINGEATDYTVGFDDNDGFFAIFNFSVMDGDELILNYAPGIFEGEVTYEVVDSEGNIVFADGPNPAVGEVFNGAATCPSCPSPPPTGISIDDVRAFTTKISWIPSDPDGTYIIEYDTSGFTPGMDAGAVLNVNGMAATLTDLEENTVYDFYISVACSNGDTSSVLGPFTFQTLFANDVGIVGISTPDTDCGLSSMDTITISLQNFGGQPQSLIRFNYSVNGVSGNVPEFVDGYYTGVLGKDSVELIPFETTFDFSQPGVYNILAWTELEDDSVIENDTFAITITNIPIIAELPYYMNFEEWTGGWTVAAESQASSWEYGQPNGPVISGAAGGQYAWVTNLEGDYNNGELSYLLSPCMDFSQFTVDPTLAFSLNFDSEACCDEGWVEYTVDNGESWQKVGAAGDGVNWYNDDINNWWDGDGGFTGWVIASSELTGTAGEAEVRLRFVFSTDGSVVNDGMGIDNVYIFSDVTNDIALVTGSNTSEIPCGEENDMVTVSLYNFGTEAQTGFDISYQVNGGDIITENVGSLTIGPGEEATYTFVQPFNSAANGFNEVLVWTELAVDEFLLNDTAFFSFPLFSPLPVAEDFESGNFPASWTTDEFNPIFAPDLHNNPTTVIADNNFSGDQTFEVRSSLYGPLDSDNYFLSVDYRYVDWSAGTDPTTLDGDSLLVEISNDCGETFNPVFVVDASNHTPTVEFTTIGGSLSEFAGDVIQFRIRNVWGQGDYWIDLDNINVSLCQVDVAAQVRNESETGLMDGSITLEATSGVAPYTYQWSTGDSTAVIDSLSAGLYEVVVTDARGCSDSLALTVDIGVAVEEIDRIGEITLAPNPTTGQSWLRISFTESVDARIQIVNLLGQTLFNTIDRNVRSVEHEIDLSGYQNGLYLIRVMVDEQVKTLKIIKVGG